SIIYFFYYLFFFSSRRRHTRFSRDWSSDVCSSDLIRSAGRPGPSHRIPGSPTEGAPWIRPPPIGREFRNKSRRRQSREARREARSEERRVGKECRSRWSAYH